MFEVGDRVVLSGFDKPLMGQIVELYYDEGTVWVVRTDGGNLHDCCDSELSPA